MLRFTRPMWTKVAAVANLSNAFRDVEQVWNVEFDKDKVVTEELQFHVDQKAKPIFHVMDLAGNADGSLDKGADGNEVFKFTVNGTEDVFPREIAERAIRTMLTHNVMDKILLEAQRQGRISFYMTQFGEEAAVIGAAAALAANDEVYMQYRETGLLTYRGYSINQCVAQCMGTCEDHLKGRQMPIHYGSKEHHAQMISSPLGTQIPHAAGSGYAFRLENEALLAKAPAGTDIASLPEARICAAFIGEGACSEGDFHAGVNFAATAGSNSLFFVRNNGYAISTPTHDQYAGDGILARGIGYGIPSARIDGVDFLAVYHTVSQARKRILRESRPYLIEAMTYRVSHHSTSDDSTAYRSKDELEHMRETFDPIPRFEKFLLDCNWWTKEQSAQVQEEAQTAVMTELRRQEKLPPWPVDTMMDDVFEKRTPHLEKQREELLAHYNKHKATYDQEKL